MVEVLLTFFIKFIRHPFQHFLANDVHFLLLILLFIFILYLVLEDNESIYYMIFLIYLIYYNYYIMLKAFNLILNYNILISLPILVRILNKLLLMFFFTIRSMVGINFILEFLLDLSFILHINFLLYFEFDFKSWLKNKYVWIEIYLFSNVMKALSVIVYLQFNWILL